MPNPNFTPVTGIIQSIRGIPGQCCSQAIQLRTDNGPVVLQLSPETFVASNRPLRPRMRVTAFYDAEQPAPAIFPPQYQAILVAPLQPGQQATVQFFDENLLSEDGSLQLTPSRTTTILTSNGQRYACPPGDNLLLVLYSATTRSQPPQTTPEKIVVLC